MFRPVFKKAKRKQVSSIHVMQVGKDLLQVKVTLSKRRSVAIVVRPDLSVEVKAPLRASVPTLIKDVESKSGWIQEKLANFSTRAGALAPRQYVEGELFYLLGTEYKLRLLKGAFAGVQVKEGFLEVTTKTKSPAAVKAALKFWYHETAKQVFEERMPLCLEATENLGLPKHKLINVKKMKGRWGSCSTDRTITLSAELVAAPVECIDYVIVHELCHLREHNHSPRYYKLLATAMPDWKKRREMLNSKVQNNFI